VLLLSGILSALFSLAKKDGLILDNPAHGLREQLGLSSRITEARPEVHALTDEHQARLKVALQDAPPFLARFVAFGLNSGCRIGESLGLRWQDVDEVTREMHITWTLSAPTERRKTVTERLGLAKSGKSRRVHISADLLPILRDLRRAGMADALKAGRPFTGAAFVFARPDGTPYHQTVVRAGFRRLMRRAGLPDFTPHVLRHTFAVSLLKDGCPITLVQSLLGHASVQMTGDVYGRWVPSDDRSWIDRLGDRMRLPEAARERLVAGDAPRRRVASVSQMPAAVSQISRNPAEFLSIPTKEEVTAPVIQI
jgi:integrase